MAIVMDSVDVVGLRQTHFEQLMVYVNDVEDSGVYYGNKTQFIKRHNDIVEWLEGILERLNDGEIIPKK